MKGNKESHLSTLYACLLVILLAVTSCSSGIATQSTVETTYTDIPLPTNTDLIQMTSTSLPDTPTPKPEPGFMINGKPFKFLGAFIPGSYWGEWSHENNVAIVTEAREAGITVFHLMLPQYEKTLGNYNENELRKLDDLVDIANQNGLYLIITFSHGLALATQTDSPYSNPGGVEGLIHQEELRTAFKKYMAALITRTNTINGRKYSEDPTILSWTIMDEIVSAPFNYPGGFPNITATEIADWVQENAAYIKSIDPNHLVSIHITPAVDTFDSMNQDWATIVNAPALDFIETEDAEARISYHQNQMYTFDKLFSLAKPVVIMLSYTGGGVDAATYAEDYQWQTDNFKQSVDLYSQKGAVGFLVFSWRASQNTKWENYSYSSENSVIVSGLQNISTSLGELNIPSDPLEFVTLNP